VHDRRTCQRVQLMLKNVFQQRCVVHRIICVTGCACKRSTVLIAHKKLIKYSVAFNRCST
jgi:hypothetical protein